jgi:ParB-like chromosome segregation protein Spo0J
MRSADTQDPPGIVGIPLARLLADPHARALDRDHVTALADSTVEIRLLEPAVVRPAGTDYEVMAGRRPCSIPVFIVKTTALPAKVAS